LKYYAGILFLTTNRVGDFDEAFTSRIHVSLYYPHLDLHKTIEVFKINLEMIESRFKDKGRTIVMDDPKEFASKHFRDHPHARWNGRQIQNACQTALALAEFEAQGESHETIANPDAIVHLKISHFETVQKGYLEFTKYMNDLWGSNAAVRAKEAKLRAFRNDEGDNVVMGQGVGNSQLNKKLFFTPPTQQPTQPVHTQIAQQQSQPQQGGFQQQTPMQYPQSFPVGNQMMPNPGMHPYYTYGNPATSQAVYSQTPSQIPMQQPMQQQYQQQYSVSPPWSPPGANVAGGSRPGQADGQVPIPQVLPSSTTPPPPPQQHRHHQDKQQQQTDPFL
jgi:hypothetical protein